jgi:hypothetical protein
MRRDCSMQGRQKDGSWRRTGRGGEMERGRGREDGHDDAQ